MNERDAPTLSSTPRTGAERHASKLLHLGIKQIDPHVSHNVQ